MLGTYLCCWNFFPVYKWRKTEMMKNIVTSDVVAPLLDDHLADGLVLLNLVLLVPGVT